MTDPISTAIVKVAPAAVKILMPKLLQHICGELKDLAADIHHAVFNAFSKYTQGMYEKHSYFSSLVFPNQQLRLKDFYLPLTLQFQDERQPRTTLVDDFPFDVFNEKKDLLIVDQAGMGKSTLLKFTFLVAVEKDLGIPIFLELRKLKPTESILSYVFNQLKTLDGSLDESLVVRLLESGQFIFFLDGFDEVADADREGVTEKLKDFKRRANKNRFIITSRDQVGLAALADFFRVTIQPLNFEEAISLIRKYSAGSELGESLIEKLQSPANVPIHEFLTNPLLVSLLFKAYEHKHTIPLKKHIFYRQVFDALFENHDLSKDAGEFNRKKLCGLDIYSFDKVLRAIGFLSLESGRVEYPKDDFLRLIEAAKKLTVGLDFNPQAMLQDLVTRAPLFVVDGNYYRWNHKSIQEYFAALYLSEEGAERKKIVLTAMYSSFKASSYINFFFLYSDVDVKGFRHYFLPLLIGELVFNYQLKSNFYGVSSESIKNRVGFCIFRAKVVVNLPEEDILKSRHVPNMPSPDLQRRTNDLFEEAKKALQKSNPTFRSNGSSSLTFVNPTVINFDDQRFSFITQVVEFLPINICSVALFAGADIGNVGDLYRNSDWMPIGLTAMTDDNTCPFNALEVFDEVNKLLGRGALNIKFDVALALQLKNDLEKSLSDQAMHSFNF